ncbi:hypothetical protein Tco_0870630 [Tanacetum coccineum]
MMDDPNITMEEYIRLEEEKAQKHGKVFNWETAKYGKIWYDKDIHDLRSVENEFPAIVFNDNLTSNETFFCEPTVSSLIDNEIDFRISFDESNDEDYTVVFDKNSFSYKIISTNDFKMDPENDNEKVNMPLFPSPEPTVSCIDDLDFFKDFENEFPAIVYNDALTSKSDFSAEPTLCPQHINEFDLKDETTLSEYDEKEQNVLYFNDLFPFDIIYPDDQKSKGNDDNEIDMIQSLGGNENTQGSNKLLEESHDKISKVFIMRSFVMELNVNIMAWNYLVNGMLFNLIKNLYVSFGIPFEPKWYYKDGDYARMLRRPRYVFFTLLNLGKIGLQERIRRIRLKPIRHMALPPRDQRYQYLRYEGLQYTDTDIADFETRLARIYRREVHRVQVFDFGGLSDLIPEGLSTKMLMEHRDAQGQSVFTSRAWRRLFDIRGPLVHELILEFFSMFRFGEAMFDLDTAGALQFQLGGVRRRDFFRYTPSYSIIRDPMLRLYHRLIVYSISRRSRALEKEEAGAMISRDMTELVRLQICLELDDTLAWVPAGPARKEGDAGGVIEKALVAPGGGDEDKEMPQAVPPPPRTQGERITRLEEEVHGMHEALQGQREVLDSMACDFSRFTTWTVTSLTRLIDRAGVPYMRYSESSVKHQRCTRQRANSVGTSTALQQPDP